MGDLQQAGDLVIATIPFMLASQKHLEAIGAERAWSLEYVETSLRRAVGVERNTSSRPDTIDFTYRWELLHKGYGDSQDVREGRYSWGAADTTVPLGAVCPPKINTVTLT